MVRPRNGQSSLHLNEPEQKSRFTGQRFKALRPVTYRRVMELLAEPREQVPYDHICRLLQVSEHTVKAVEKAESASIAERKRALLSKAVRIAHKAADRVEDQIDDAPLPQAIVAFGVMADKVALLSNDSHQINVSYSIQPGQRAYEVFNRLAAALGARFSQDAHVAGPLDIPDGQSALPAGLDCSDTG